MLKHACTYTWRVGWYSVIGREYHHHYHHHDQDQPDVDESGMNDDAFTKGPQPTASLGTNNNTAKDTPTKVILSEEDKRCNVVITKNNIFKGHFPRHSKYKCLIYPQSRHGVILYRICRRPSVETDIDFFIVFKCVDDELREIRVNHVYFAKSSTNAQYFGKMVDFTDLFYHYYVDQIDLESQFYEESLHQRPEQVLTLSGLHPYLINAPLCQNDERACKDHSKEHMLTVYHYKKRPPLCEYGMRCHELNDFFHTSVYRHEIRRKACIFFQDGTCNDYSRRHRNNFSHFKKPQA